VVISIIALLVGILLPALGAARKSAQIMASASNQRQIAIAMLSYATDNGQRWMLWQRSDGPEGMVDGTVEWIWSSQLLLLNYLPTFDIYVDPSWDAEAPFLDLTVTEEDAADETLRTLHYGYNYVFLGSNIGHYPTSGSGTKGRGHTERSGPPVPVAMPPSIDEVASPTNTLVTTLSRLSTEYNLPEAGGAHVVLDAPRGINFAGAPDPRHNDNAQTSWADGHVSQVPVPGADEQFTTTNIVSAYAIPYRKDAFGDAQQNLKYLGSAFASGNYFDLHASNPGD
jgi:prepilin-type processing-associated H-X9-DG protein